MSSSPQPQLAADLRKSQVAPFPLNNGNENAPPATRNLSLPHNSSTVRSCVTCRRKKVRCNKRSPCSNCVRAGVECIFPSPGRAPRSLKRPPAENAELLLRLRQLEDIVEAAIANPNIQPFPPRRLSDGSSGDPPEQFQPSHDEGETGVQRCPVSGHRIQHLSLEHEFGRLVIEDNRSRYVSNRFWASLGDQIEELQDILDHSSSEDDDYLSPEPSSYSTMHDGMLFGFYSLAHTLQIFHPPPSKVPVLWDIYAENVKPLLPVVYGPAAQQLFVVAAETPDNLDKNDEALVLAMYFAAIVSMSAEQCAFRLGEVRDTLVSRFRFGVEQALSKASLMNTQSLTLMQAAVIFLNAVRRDDDTKFVWSMSALILRLAQGLGLHRDGNNFDLKPFDAEMRRRLWWHVILLDLRSSEDHGTDVQIHDQMFDTRLPLNVNETDLSPDAKEQPKPRVGFTDMTFFLIRCDICYALRRVAYTCPNTSGAISEPTSDNCPSVVQTVNMHIEEQYLKHCDMSDPIQWISATVARLVLTKMWLVIHHPVTRSGLESRISHESRESLFITSIEVTEFARLIKEDKNTQKWSWMFDAHMQWHAIAMLLSELCVRPLSPLTDRAWIAVTTVYDDWLHTAKQRKGMLWRPLAKLMKRAGALRKRQLAEIENQHVAAQHTKHGSTGPERPSIGSPFSSHFPEHSKLVAAAPPMDLNHAQLQGPLDFDLSRGPMDGLSPFFPDGNFLATPESFSSSTQAAVNLKDPTTLSNGQVSGTLQNPSNNQEWDQVLRDFQSDMQEIHGNPLADITAWMT
ncbi:fungal-specific transcription factor domain-containing protein [Aspergillus desertorum]